jgi:hypothetical protein
MGGASKLDQLEGDEARDDTPENRAEEEAVPFAGSTGESQRDQPGSIRHCGS